MPILDGGASMTARDLARYGQIFVRGGIGVNGEAVGNRAFIDEARTAEAKHFPAPRDWLRYCLHLQTNGRWVGHGGYGGQYLLADPESGVSVAFFSVLEDESGYDQQYIGDTILMCQEIAELPFG
jgi:CubicO group peptidase (beta-lactamase class C family)